MARPTNADSARTVETIITAALAVIAESRRVDDLSLRQVAQRAGVGLSTVQYYFATRDTLLDACLDGYHQRLTALASELVTELSAQTRPVHEQIERTVRTFFRFAQREKTLIQLRVSTTLTHREARTLARDQLGAAIIREAAKALVTHASASLIEARFAVHSMSALIVRSALASDVELESITEQTGPAALDVIEAQLVRAAMKMLGIERPSAG